MIHLTLAATPRRGQVLAAKATVVAGVTIATGLISVLGMFVVSQFIYESAGMPTASLTNPDTVRVLAAMSVLAAVFPLMGQPMLHKGIAVIILGGMGDIRGAMIGGLFLGFAEVLSVAYIGSTMRDAVAFGLLFLILLVRPQGLFGKVLERKA